MSQRPSDYPDFLDEVYHPKKNQICEVCNKPITDLLLITCPAGRINNEMKCPAYKG